MEHPEAGAAAAAAGQGTPGSPRGSWCHPTSRHPTALPTVVSWVPSWHVGAGAVIPGAQTHPLQHARACTHCRLLLWARTHLATRTGARAAVLRGTPVPALCPSSLHQGSRKTKQSHEARRSSPTAPTGWRFWKAAGSGFSPTFPPDPDPTQAFLQGRARARGCRGAASILLWLRARRALI